MRRVQVFNGAGCKVSVVLASLAVVLLGANAATADQYTYAATYGGQATAAYANLFAEPLSNSPYFAAADKQINVRVGQLLSTGTIPISRIYKFSVKSVDGNLGYYVESDYTDGTVESGPIYVGSAAPYQWHTFSWEGSNPYGNSTQFVARIDGTAFYTKSTPGYAVGQIEAGLYSRDPKTVVQDQQADLLRYRSTNGATYYWGSSSYASVSGSSVCGRFRTPYREYLYSRNTCPV